jgi:DNA-binding transcriptional regulator YiaG
VNIGKVLRLEIQRLARKEVKAASTRLHKIAADLKRRVAALKRRTMDLERQSKRLRAVAGDRRLKAPAAADQAVRKARITAKMIRTIRSRLGLAQAGFAKLLGVSSQTVYQWEHKKGRLHFRGDVKARIVSARKTKKREVKKLIES